MIKFDSIRILQKDSTVKSFETRLKRIISTYIGSYALELDSYEGKYLFDSDFGSEIPSLLSSYNTLESIDAAKSNLENILSKEKDIKNFKVSIDKKFNRINIYIDYTFIKDGNKSSLSFVL